jgi:hypothetical protein
MSFSACRFRDAEPGQSLACLCYWPGIQSSSLSRTLPAQVKEAMNDINAAQRLRLAAVEKAEASKVKVVKEAEAEAEAKYLQGAGVARQRQVMVLLGKLCCCSQRGTAVVCSSENGMYVWYSAQCCDVTVPRFYCVIILCTTQRCQGHRVHAFRLLAVVCHLCVLLCRQVLAVCFATLTCRACTVTGPTTGGAQRCVYSRKFGHVYACCCLHPSMACAFNHQELSYA